MNAFFIVIYDKTTKFHAKFYIPGADKSLARRGRKQARMHVTDARDFNKIETRAVFKFVFLQGGAPKEIHAILTETLACFLPGRAKDLSAPLISHRIRNLSIQQLVASVLRRLLYCGSEWVNLQGRTGKQGALT